MSIATSSPLIPRKRPSQDRSKVTVEAVFEATLQVLERDGYARLTTTRIAERAGISVGSLYQYFPNKRTLLAELLRSHMRRIVDAVASAADDTCGQLMEVRIRAIVSAFVSIKREHVRASRALHAVFADLNISSLAAPELQRAQSIAAEVVRSHCEQIGADPELAALILVSGLEGPVTQLVMTAPEALMNPQLVVHLQAAALGYLSTLAL